MPQSQRCLFVEWCDAVVLRRRSDDATKVCGDPAFGDPSKFIGPVYDEAQARRLAADMGWTVKPDGDKWRRVVPSPLPQRLFQLRPIRWLLEKGTVVIAAGGGGIAAAPGTFAPLRAKPKKQASSMAMIIVFGGIVLGGVFGISLGLLILLWWKGPVDGDVLKLDLQHKLPGWMVPAAPAPSTPPPLTPEPPPAN